MQETSLNISNAATTIASISNSRRPASHVSIGHQYKEGPKVGKVSTTEQAAALAAAISFESAAEEVLLAFRETRLRQAPEVAVRALEAPCVPPEASSAPFPPNYGLSIENNSSNQVSAQISQLSPAQRLAEIVPTFRGKLVQYEAVRWAKTTLALGDALMALGEFHAAAIQCYAPCLLHPEPRPGVPVPDADALSAHCRATMGIAMASAGLARIRDPRMETSSTLSQILLCLTRIQAAAQLVISARPRVARERLYFIIFNAAACTLMLAEPLITFDGAFALRVLPFLNFCILAIEATPHLATPQHLPLRVRLYGATCRAFERMGIVSLSGSLSAATSAAPTPAAKGKEPPAAAVSATDSLPSPDDESIIKTGDVGLNLFSTRRAIARAIKTVGALRRMYQTDPPLLENTFSDIDSCLTELYIRRFRYDSYLSVSSACSQLNLDVGSSGARISALIGALSWGHSSFRRIARHSPPGSEATRVIEAAASNSLSPSNLPSNISGEAASKDEASRVREIIIAIMRELQPVLTGAVSATSVINSYSTVAVEKSIRGFSSCVRGLPSAGAGIGGGNVRGGVLKGSRDASIPMLQEAARAATRSFESTETTNVCFPLQLHMALIRILFSYEFWAEMSFFMHLAEARCDFALQECADKTLYSPRGGVLSSEDSNERILSEQERETIHFAHELLLLRRLYELQYGILPVMIEPPVQSAPVAVAPASAAAAAVVPAKDAKGKAAPAKGAPAPAAAPTPASATTAADVNASVAEKPLPSASPLVAALSAGHVSSLPLPSIKVTTIQVLAAAEALSACTRSVPLPPPQGQPVSSFVLATPLGGGASLCSTQPDLIRDFALILAEHVLALQAWRDSRDIGFDRDAKQKAIVADTLFSCYKALHTACAKVSLDDPILRGVIGLRLAALFAERNDVVQAVQVARSSLSYIQAARDRQLSISFIQAGYSSCENIDAGSPSPSSFGVTDADMISLAHLSSTITVPPQALVDSYFPNSHVATQSSILRGKSFNMWTSHATLASLHADMLSLWALLELRYASWEVQQTAVVNIKRHRVSTAKAAAQAVRKRPASKLLKRFGEDETDKKHTRIKGEPSVSFSADISLSTIESHSDNIIAQSVDADDYNEYLREAVEKMGKKFKGWAPSAIQENQILNEVGKNAAARAIVHIAAVQWRYDARSRRDELGLAFSHLEAAEKQEIATQRVIVGTLERLYEQNNTSSSTSASNSKGESSEGLTQRSPQKELDRSRSPSPELNMSAGGIDYLDGSNPRPLGSTAGPPRTKAALHQLALSAVRPSTMKASSKENKSATLASTQHAVPELSGRTIAMDPKTGLPTHLQEVKSYSAPVILCKNSTSITLAPTIFPGSSNFSPVPTTRGRPAEPVSYYCIFGKAYGSGTEAGVSNNRLVGTGSPAHLVSGVGSGSALNDVYAMSTDPESANVYAVRALPPPIPRGKGKSRAPNDAPLLQGQPETSTELSRCLSVAVSNLSANDVYNFACGAFTSTGQLAGASVSASTPPILAATPLPLHLLWGYLAMEAHRVGELRVARAAALRVVSVYVSSGPLRPAWSERPNPAAIYTLRRDLIQFAPRAVVQILVRCLCILADSGESGLPPNRTEGVPMKAAEGADNGDGSIVPPTSVSDHDGWTFDAHVDGRALEGPMSPDEANFINSMPYGARLQLAALQRVGTLCVAVEAASSLYDPHLIQLAVCACFNAMLPVLSTGGGVRPSAALLQPLLLCHQAIGALPRESLQPASSRALARIVYELTIVCLHAGPMLSAPGFVRDTAYARSVVAGSLGQTTSAGATKPLAVLLADTTTTLPPSKTPGLDIGGPSGRPSPPIFSPLRDYSPWVVETAANEPVLSLLPPPAMTTNYNLFADPFHAAIAASSDRIEGKEKLIRSLPFGSGAGFAESEKTALAHFLLWSPKWADQLDAAGVAGLVGGETASLVKLISSISGISAESTTTPKDAFGKALATLLKNEEVNVQAMSDIWSVSRNSGPLAAIDLIIAKFAINAEQASTPAPASAAAPAPAGKAAAKGAPAAAASAPSSSATATSSNANVSPPSFNPLFVQLICRVVTSALVQSTSGTLKPTIPPTLLSGITSILDKVNAYVSSSAGAMPGGIPLVDVSSIRSRFGSVIKAARVDGLSADSSGLLTAASSAAALDGVASVPVAIALALAASRPAIAAALIPAQLSAPPSPVSTQAASATASQKDGVTAPSRLNLIEASDVDLAAAKAKAEYDESEFQRIRTVQFIADVLMLTRLEVDDHFSGDDSSITDGAAPGADSERSNGLTWAAMRQADAFLIGSGSSTASVGSSAGATSRYPLLWLSHVDLLRAKAFYNRLLSVAQVQQQLATAADAHVEPGSPNLGWRDASVLASANATTRQFQGYDGDGPWSLFPHISLLTEPSESESISPGDPQRSEPQFIYKSDPVSVSISSPDTLSSSMPLLRLVLSAASDSAVEARGALAWATVRDAARTAWSAIGASFAGPQWFGHIENVFPASVGTANASESAAAVRPSSGFGATRSISETAPSPTHDEANLWKILPANPSLPAIERKPVALDWRPVWRISLCLLDLIDALARSRVERSWGRGLGHSSSATSGGMGPSGNGAQGAQSPDNSQNDDGADIASDDGMEADEGMGSPMLMSPSIPSAMQGRRTTPAPDSIRDMSSSIPGELTMASTSFDLASNHLGNVSAIDDSGAQDEKEDDDDDGHVASTTLPEGITLDDIVWISRFIAFTSLALLHAQAFHILTPFAHRAADAYEHVVRLLGGRNAIAQSPLPATPDLGWSGLGAGPVRAPQLAVSEMSRGGDEDASDPYGFVIYPGYFVDTQRNRLRDLARAVANPSRGHGAALADDAFATCIRMGLYAARTRWSQSAALLDSARAHLVASDASFNDRPSLKQRLRLKRSSVDAQNALLDAEEEMYLPLRQELVARERFLASQCSGRLASFRRLEEIIVYRARDMSLPRKQLTKARGLMSKYVRYSTGSGHASSSQLPFSSQAVLPLSVALAAASIASNADAGAAKGSSMSAIRSLRSGTASQIPSSSSSSSSEIVVVAPIPVAPTLILPSFSAVLGGYQSTISLLRKRRDSALLCQALHELGNLYWSRASFLLYASQSALGEGHDEALNQASRHVRLAFDVWKDGLDVAFGAMDVHLSWRDHISKISSSHSASAEAEQRQKEASDAASGKRSATRQWQTIGTGLYDRHGFAGCALPSILASKMIVASQTAAVILGRSNQEAVPLPSNATATASADVLLTSSSGPMANTNSSKSLLQTSANSDSSAGRSAPHLHGALLSQKQMLDLHLLSAFCISAIFSVSAVLHPTRDVEFSRHRPSVWVPGTDVFSDERIVSAQSLMLSLRTTANGLLEYGTAFAERALPVVCALEYIAGARLADVPATIEARILRARCQVAIGDLEGAVDSLSGVLRADGLPNSVFTSPSSLLSGFSIVKPTGGASAESTMSFDPVPHTALPRFYNHLPPIHPVNRAAMSWLAADASEAPQAQLPRAVAVVCGKLIVARLHLLRAEICRAILERSKCARAHVDFFGELGVGPDLEHPNSWYGSVSQNAASVFLNKAKGTAGDPMSNKPSHASSEGSLQLYPVKSLYAGLSKEQLRWPMMQGTAAAATPAPAPGKAATKTKAPIVDVGGSSADDAAAVAGDEKWINSLLKGGRAYVSIALLESGVLNSQSGISVIKPELIGLLPPTPQQQKDSVASTATAAPSSPGRRPEDDSKASASSMTLALSSLSPACLSVAALATSEAALLASARGEHRFAAAAATETLRLMSAVSDPSSVFPHIMADEALIAAYAADEEAIAKGVVSQSSFEVGQMLKRAFSRKLDDNFAVRMGMPSWISMRLVICSSLLSLGAVGEADIAITLALREATASGDHVSADRAYILQAAVATMVGDAVLATECLSAVIGPALSACASNPLTFLESAAFAASKAYAIVALSEATMVARAINALVGLERSLGAHSPQHSLVDPLSSPGMPPPASTKLFSMMTLLDGGAEFGVGYRTQDAAQTAMSNAAELRLLLLSERLTRQRLGALGVDVRRMDLAADNILRSGSVPSQLIDAAQPSFSLDTVYCADMEVLGEVRDAIGDSIISAALSSHSVEGIAESFSSSQGPNGRKLTALQAAHSLAALAARKRAQQLVVCHHIAAAQPSMIVCASLGVARSIRVWLALDRRVGNTVSSSSRKALLTAAELHCMVAFEVSRILVEHDVNLLRFAAVELCQLYLYCSRSLLIENSGQDDGRGFVFDEHADPDCGAIQVPVKANEDLDRAMKYALCMLRLSGRLGIVAQRTLANKPAEFVASRSGRGSSVGGKGGAPAAAAAAPGKGGALPVADGVLPEDEKLRSILPPALFDDLQMYRKASALSASQIVRVASNGQAPPVEPPVQQPSPASVLYAHMAALNSIIRAWPAPSGPLALTLEDAAQSLHSALCTLVPEFRSQWGLGRSLTSRLSAAFGAATGSAAIPAKDPKAATTGPAVTTFKGHVLGPSSLRAALPDADCTKVKDLCATVIASNDENVSVGETAMVIMMLGPTSAGLAARTSSGSGKSAAAAGSVAATPRTTESARDLSPPPILTDPSGGDVLVLKLVYPARDLLQLRQSLCDLRRRLQQLLDPAAADARKILEATASATATGAAPAAAAAGATAQSQRPPLTTSVSATPSAESLEREAAYTVAELNRLSTTLAALTRSSSRRLASGPVPSILQIAKDLKATSPAASASASAAAAAKAGTKDEKDAGDESEDEAAPPKILSASPTGLDASSIYLSLKVVDGLCKLLDHRFGGSVRNGAINTFMRTCLGLE
jgi:hypothetical protein